MSALTFGRGGAGFVLVTTRPWFPPVDDFSDKERYVYGSIARLILESGGSGVVLDPSAWPSARPTLVRASKVGLVYRRGKPNGCHSNAAALAAKHPSWTLWSGWYRQFRDGIWRSHSWLRDSRGRVVETTNPSEWYLGAPENGGTH